MNEPDSNNELRLTESQIRSTVAIAIVVVVFLCVMSYHWGKKKAYEEFADTCRSEELSDKISMAICQMNADAAQAPEESASEKKTESHSSEIAPAISGASVQSMPAVQEQKNTVSSEAHPKLYQALLIGFKDLDSAQQYQKKLEKRGIGVKILPRTSTSKRGATRTWYQVVSVPADHKDTMNLVEQLQVEEHLHGSTIIACAS
jgi:hypothetical protein